MSRYAAVLHARGRKDSDPHRVLSPRMARPQVEGKARAEQAARSVRVHAPRHCLNLERHEVSVLVEGHTAKVQLLLGTCELELHVRRPRREETWRIMHVSGERCIRMRLKRLHARLSRPCTPRFLRSSSVYIKPLAIDGSCSRLEPDDTRGGHGRDFFFAKRLQHVGRAHQPRRHLI